MTGSDDHSIIDFLKKYQDIITVLAVGIGFGVSIGVVFLKWQRIQLYDQIQAIKKEISDKQSIIQADSINFKNWQVNHIHSVSLNDEQNDLPVLSATNNSTKSFGKTWVKGSMVIMAGDNILFKITFHNSGKSTIYQPFIGFGILPTANDTLTAIGELIVGNQVLKYEYIKLAVNPRNHQFFYPQINQFFINGKLISENPISHKYDYGFPIHDIKPDSTVTLLYNYEMKISLE